MTRLFTFIALAALICCTPARADVTAKQAWESWHAQMAGSGYEVTFDEAMSGGILTINNLTVSKALGNDQGPTTTEVGSIGFRERGDGSVEVILATDAPITLRPKDGQSVTFIRRHTGMSYIISGAPDAVTHTVSADEIIFSLTELVEDGQKVEAAKIDVVLKNLSSSAFMETTSLSRIVMDYDIAELTYDIDIKGNGEPARAFAMKGSFTDFKGTFDATIPENFDPEEIKAAIDAGLMMKAKFGYAIAQYQIWLAEGKDIGSSSFSSSGGIFDFSMQTKPSGMFEVLQLFTIASLSFKLDDNEADRDRDVGLEMSIDELKGSFKALFPENFDPDSIPAAFDSGFSVNADLGHGPLMGTLITKEPAKSATGTVAIDSSELVFSVDRKRTRYGGGIIGQNLMIAATQAPVSPIEYSLAEMSFLVQMPLRKSMEPDPFGFDFKLSDLWINEGAWRLIDPKATLSHDPVTVVLGLSGMGNWLIDILDAESEEAQNATLKGQLHALTLNDLRISGAGTEVTGHGEFTFDNDDMETFDGIPAPTGQISLNLTGINALIDKLLELGLLPEDQAMGARMALGLFTVAGKGKDVLTSDIVIDEDGKVLANGQRLK